MKFAMIRVPCALLLFKFSNIPSVTIHGDAPCFFVNAKKIVKKTRTQKRKRVLQIEDGTGDVPRMSSPQLMQPSWPLCSFIAQASSQFLSHGRTIAQSSAPSNASATQATQLPVTTSLTTRVPTTETMPSSTAAATFLMPIHTKDNCQDVLEVCKAHLAGLETQTKNEIKPSQSAENADSTGAKSGLY